ncbi:tRNA pseudouridine(55) synthase TruB [Propionimicrobium lymphophilum]|uniref:tRNA pseudouridine synthase B n=1 Tax=Propionimicrobium lymphophilum ACS-093-V-SCH5 TaxID=883161 RepID=S2W4L0_9ACTN|nr:tRNA pseudouridine(55) synthase TruB [Propionimicrobium lymphophilum]EPD33190.1 tRNA pseudouridine(55) synthase [Propionimicrobium lymphophilum ACS-093-V-SCH5]MDK7709975.1 tRNA pseudouridine(55) synthase TruB [Propionimicrobium lymphophilum]MDK7732776.1 tRNA pseudouridine(55) synthase TruB [Propionimicrobium lymphophilum]
MSDSGILIVDKPAGLTSQQVVGRVRRVFDARKRKLKVGHAGTLDPMATGVLIVGVGKATRLLGHLALHDKAYSATIRLGQSTSTDDAEGELIQASDASSISEQQLAEAIKPLTGDIMQVPSSVSAIKVNGKRAYALARKGEDVALAARPVTVSRFDVLDVRRLGEVLDVDVEVEVSSGTYVRALARDLGEALGVGGHLTMLRRSRIGRYNLADAVALDDISEEAMMPMARAARFSFPVRNVDEAQARNVGYGKPLDITVEGPVTGLVDPEGNLIALYAPDDSGAKPLAVLI